MDTEALLLNLFQQLKCGAILLDERETPARWNNAALQHLAHMPDAKRGEGADWLKSQISRVAPKNGLISVLPAEHGRHLVVKRIAASPPTCGALLIFLDIRDSGELDRDLLQRVFGLTRAEASLAQWLARGCSLQETAEKRGVSVGTARMQLKSILAKTHTRRQAELIRLLARLSLLS
jgi:DNA-binding CsgD family transcriptional regulator